MPTPPKFIRFPDLVERGIVKNRVTLGRWIRHNGFPPGVLIGANTRIWDEAEIDKFIADRRACSRDVRIKIKAAEAEDFEAEKAGAKDVAEGIDEPETETAVA